MDIVYIRGNIFVVQHGNMACKRNKTKKWVRAYVCLYYFSDSFAGLLLHCYFALWTKVELVHDCPINKTDVVSGGT